LRITFLLTQSLESPSGLGRYWALSKALARLGHEVTILALHHDLRSSQQRTFVKDNITVRYVGQMHVRKLGNRKVYFGPLHLMWHVILSTWGLLTGALRAPTDVYHLGKPHPMNGIAGILASRLRSKPLYVDFDDYEVVSNRFGADWQRRVVGWFESVLPRLSDGNTVNTRFMLREVSALQGDNEAPVVRVPNGVDRRRFSITSREGVDELRQSLGVDGRKVVLYLGSMSLANHAVDLLLEAFQMVKRLEPDAVLLLVGGGEDYDNLLDQANALGLSGASLFVGRVPPDRAVLYYHLADVSVDPVQDDLTAQTRFPLKIVESLVTGTPVVTGDVGDRREILGDGKAGVLVSPGDKQALASGILHILEDSEVAAKMSRSARTLGSAYYWDRLAPLWLTVYERE
jgi:glycosyltransferase involved in cell wall biosynthesis